MMTTVTCPSGVFGEALRSRGNRKQVRNIEGSMNQEQQHLVRASFAKVTPIADTAAAMFYDRLFAADPTLRPLFKGDMVEQGRLLMTMIGPLSRMCSIRYCRLCAISGG